MQIDRPISIALILFAVLLLAYFLVIPEYNTFTSLQTQLGEKTAEYNAEVDYHQDSVLFVQSKILGDLVQTDIR